MKNKRKQSKKVLKTITKTKATKKKSQNIEAGKKGGGFGDGIVNFGKRIEADGEELLGFVGKLGDVALGVGTALTGIVAGGLSFVAQVRH